MYKYVVPSASGESTVFIRGHSNSFDKIKSSSKASACLSFTAEIASEYVLNSFRYGSPFSTTT